MKVTRKPIRRYIYELELEQEEMIALHTHLLKTEKSCGQILLNLRGEILREMTKPGDMLKRW